MNKTEQRIKLISETKTPLKINGVFIDTFTATMINTVAQKLNEDNRNQLFKMPIKEIVALSYKIMSYKNEASSHEKLKMGKTGIKKDADALGLDYYGFGRYGKNDKVSHISKNGRLIPIDKVTHQSNIIQSPHTRMGNKPADVSTGIEKTDKGLALKYGDDKLDTPSNLVAAINDFAPDILKTAHKVASSVQQKGGDYTGQLYGSVLDQLRGPASTDEFAKKLFLKVRELYKKVNNV